MLRGSAGGIIGVQRPWAHTVLGAAGPTPPTPGAFDSLVLTNPAYALFGTQQLISSATYTGPAFTAQRTSDDATMDFPPNTTSLALAAWTQAAGSATPICTQVFDQSGNSRTLPMSGSGVPLDVSVYTYPTFLFNGATSPAFNLNTNSSGYTVSQTAISFGFATKLASITGTTRYGVSFSINTGAGLRMSLGQLSTGWSVTGRSADADGFTTVTKLTTFDLQWHRELCTVDYANRPLNLYVDGVAGTPANMVAHGTSQATTPNQASVGRGSTAGNGWLGNISAAALFQTIPTPANFDAALQALITANPLRSALMITETAWDGGIAASNVQSGRIFAHTSGSKTLTVAGVYQGSAPAIVDVQAVYADDGTVAVAWATLDAAPANNAFTGTISLLKSTRYYKIQVRDHANQGTVITSYSQLGVGIIGIAAGQSNATNLWETEVTVPSASATTRRFSGGTGEGWYLPSLPLQGTESGGNQNSHGQGGSGAIVMLNAIASAAGCVVGFVEAAIPDTSVASWQTGGASWINLTSTMLAALTAPAAADISFVLWVQGERDSVLGTAAATYTTSLTAVEAQFRTLTGNATIPFIIVPTGTQGTNAQIDTIRQAQLAYIDTNTSGHCFYGYTMGAFIAASPPHYDAPAYQTFGAWAAHSWAFQLGLSSKDASGPKLSTAAASVLTQAITLPVTQNGGTALRDETGSSSGSAINGFVVTVNGTPVTISTTAFSGNNIVLTMPALTFIISDTVTVSYLAGQNSTYTNTVFDNDALSGVSYPGFPLQYSRGTSGQIAVTVGA